MNLISRRFWSNSRIVIWPAPRASAAAPRAAASCRPPKLPESMYPVDVVCLFVCEIV